MERGKDCVERNRSERAKIANVAEWKPPASPEAQYIVQIKEWRTLLAEKLPIGGRWVMS